MRYIGLDVHKRMTAVCILDENGKKEKPFVVRGDWIKLMEVAQSLRHFEAGAAGVPDHFRANLDMANSEGAQRPVAD